MFLYSLWKAPNWPVSLIFIGSLDDRQMGLTWGQHNQQEIWVMGGYIFKPCALGLFNQGNWLMVPWCREHLHHRRWPGKDDLPGGFGGGRFPSSLRSCALQRGCESLFFFHACSSPSGLFVQNSLLNLAIVFEVVCSTISQEIRKKHSGEVHTPERPSVRSEVNGLL